MFLQFILNAYTKSSQTFYFPGAAYADYAAELLVHARQLYAFADQYRGVYTNGIPDAYKYYRSAIVFPHNFSGIELFEEMYIQINVCLTPYILITTNARMAETHIHYFSDPVIE